MDNYLAKVNPVDIDMLTRLVEGFGHLGIVSTLDRQEGLVLIRGTKDTAPELLQVLTSLPFELTILHQE